MTAPYEKGDIVKPKPNYERCANICGQCCKRKTDKSWLIYFFETGKILSVRENGHVDIETQPNNLILSNVPPEMLERADN